MLAWFGTWGIVTAAQRYVPFAWLALGRADGENRKRMASQKGLSRVKADKRSAL
ncbi:hypothetical protein ACX1C1_11925 [Paenibacillus sp. strain BS8-2]